MTSAKPLSTVVLICLAGLGLAAAPRPQAANPAAEGCSVEGVVVNAATRENLRKVRVILAKTSAGSTQSVGATTDSEGRFQVAGLSPGSYRVIAARSGFVRQPGSPTVLTLTAGQRVKDLVFRLIPAAVLGGRVSDQDGDPLPGVRIQLLRYQYTEGARRLEPVEFAITDDRGQYRIPGLRAGRYYLKASYSDRWATADVVIRPAEGTTPHEGYPALYYPGVPDPTRAMEIRLQDGEDRNGIDITIVPTRTVVIRGRVVAAAAQQGANEASVFLTPRMTGGLALLERVPVHINSNGEFEIRGVAGGSYSLQGYWDQPSGLLFGRRPIEVGDADIDNANLILKPAIDLKGRIEVEPGGASKLSAGELRVFLHARDDSTVMAGEPSAPVRADGSFELGNLTENEYQVTLLGMPPDYYLKAIRFGGHDFSITGFTIGDGSAGLLTLLLSPNGARVEGIVRGDKDQPASNVTVVLVPEMSRRGRADLYRVVKTDSSGRFIVRGLAPGEYGAFAWDQVEPGSWQDPGFLKPFESTGKKVTVEEQDRTAIDLELLGANSSTLERP